MADRNKKLSRGDFRNALEQQAKALGFSDLGIAPAQLPISTADYLQQWLGEGCHGDMQWMESRANERAQPQTLWPEARSVIMLGMSYAPPHNPLDHLQHKSNGLISVYAQGGDYHKWVKKGLKHLARWIIDNADWATPQNGDPTDIPADKTTLPQVKVFVDTAPVMEKPLAQLSGMGWQGKHSNVVSQNHGSWLFLGAIYTNLDLEADPPGPDRCGSCSACQTICPTQAFSAPYQLDARKCISYLTIEHAGPIAHHYRKAMANRVYGCDDCLAICPWNKFADSASANRAFLPRAEFVLPDLAALLSLDVASYNHIFAGSAIKRIGRNRMVRNAAIAAGNSGNVNLVPALVNLCGDDSHIVRGAAIWALWQLDAVVAEQQRQLHASGETDTTVLAEWQRQCPTR